MLRDALPYWEQADTCHSLPTSSLLLKSALKSPKSSKLDTSSLIKKQAQENVDPDPAQSKLMRSTMRLKEYKLPGKYEVATVKYMDTSGRAVFNDYHSKQTNPGYSRNNFGGFYTK